MNTELERARIDFAREREHLLDALTHANAETASLRDELASRDRSLMRLAAELTATRANRDALVTRLRSLAPAPTPAALDDLQAA